MITHPPVPDTLAPLKLASQTTVKAKQIHCLITSIQASALPHPQPGTSSYPLSPKALSQPGTHSTKAFPYSPDTKAHPQHPVSQAH